MLGSFHGCVVWGQRPDVNSESFVLCVQMFGDKTVTALKSTVLVAQPFHVILLNVSLRKMRYVIHNGRTLVEYLPVGCSEKEVHAGSGKDYNISVH